MQLPSHRFGEKNAEPLERSKLARDRWRGEARAARDFTNVQRAVRIAEEDSDDRLARFTGCLAGSRGRKTLLNDPSSVGWILRQELVESSVDNGLYGGTNLGIVELVLGL